MKIAIAFALGALCLAACGPSGPDVAETPGEALNTQEAKGGESPLDLGEDAFAEAAVSGDDATMAALAETGDPRAQLYTARHILARSGPGDPALDMARAYMESAADAGLAEALVAISEDYKAPGELYDEDLVKAHEFGLRAAEAGHVDAMLNAGLRFQYGVNGATMDADKAAYWLGEASANGSTTAARELQKLQALQSED